MRRKLPLVPFALLLPTILLVSLQRANAGEDKFDPILPDLKSNNLLAVSTVPPNGDVNPYGVAFVPSGFPEDGPIRHGDILVSNFNSIANLQGTGTTIVRVTPQGAVSVFFQGQPGLGLTTALGVLKRGFVIVGSLPTTDGTSNTVKQGSLLVLDRFGTQLANLSNAVLLDGPWDLTINDEESRAQVYISNVLSGTITRLDVRMPEHNEQVQFHIDNATLIAAGFNHRFDPNALVIGPTGLAYDHERDVLYIASTGDNAIFGLPGARHITNGHSMGLLVYQDNTHLRGPLGLVLAPNGDLITANGDAINPGGTQNALVEFTRNGHFVAQFQVNPGAGGGAFGLAAASLGDATRFAAVDDIANMLDIWTVQ